MNLKSTLATLLMVTSLTSGASEITLSPIETAYAVLATALSPIDISVGSTLISSEASSAYKEAINAVKGDALNYLAGEEATDTLLDLFAKLQAEEALRDYNNEELAVLIIEAAQ